MEWIGVNRMNRSKKENIISNPMTSWHVLILFYGSQT